MGGLNKLIVRLVGQVKDPASDIYIVNYPAKAKEVLNSESCLNLFKMKNNFGTSITLKTITFGGTE